MFATVKSRIRDLLVRSQGYTGTDNVYLAKGGFWTTLQFGAGTLASIATVIAFANLLPRETYGVYKYLLSLAGSLGFLTLTGMNTAVVRAVARDQAGLLPYAVRLQIKYNLVATLAIGGLAAYYGIHGNMVFALSLAILAVSLPLTAAYNTYGAALIGKKRFDLLSAATSLSSLIAAAAVITALLLTDSVVLLIGAYAAATLIPNLLAYWYVRRLLPVAAPAPEDVTELRRTGFHLTAVGVIGTLAQYLDKILLFQIAGPVALAVYGFAIAGPDRLKGLAKNWVSIALPRLAQRSITDIRVVFYRRVALSLGVGILFAGAYIALAPLLFRWFLPNYLDAIRYSQAYALALIFVPAAVYVSNVFQGQNMLRAIYISSTSVQVARIVLFLALVWKWQIWGLVIASVVHMFIGLIVYCIIWELEVRKTT